MQRGPVPQAEWSQLKLMFFTALAGWKQGSHEQKEQLWAYIIFWFHEVLALEELEILPSGFFFKIFFSRNFVLFAHLIEKTGQDNLFVIQTESEGAHSWSVCTLLHRWTLTVSSFRLSKLMLLFTSEYLEFRFVVMPRLTSIPVLGLDSGPCTC